MKSLRPPVKGHWQHVAPSCTPQLLRFTCLTQSRVKPAPGVPTLPVAMVRALIILNVDWHSATIFFKSRNVIIIEESRYRSLRHTLIDRFNMSLILVLPNFVYMFFVFFNFKHDAAERPLAWGKRLAEAGVGDIDDNVESEEDGDGAGSKERMTLTLGFAPREMTTVVTPSAETRSDGGTSSGTPMAVPLESVTDDGDDKKYPDVLPNSKGKGKSRGREASAAPDADDTVTVVVPSSRTSMAVERIGGSSEAEAAIKSGTEEEEEEEGSPRPKRLKVGVGRLAEAMADKNEEGDCGDVGLHEAHSRESISGYIGGQFFSKQKPEEEATRGHGVDGSGDEGGDDDGDRAEDDDNFDFPSIIDADPDSD